MSMQSGTGLGIDLNVVARLSDEEKQSMIIAGSSQVHSSTGIIRPPIITMRSAKGMSGLLQAEVGGSMVEMDKLGGLGSGFREGRSIEPGSLTPIGRPERLTTNRPLVTHSNTVIHCGTAINQSLSRHGTLLSTQASPSRQAAQLKSLLGDSSAKVKSRTVVSAKPGTTKGSFDAVAYEQGKSRIRVSLDLILENKTAVEGGCLSGLVHVKVQLPKERCNYMNLGGGKIRVAGFEVSPTNQHRHIFYQVTASLKDVSDGYMGMFKGTLNGEGFGSVEEGSYAMRFALQLPTINSFGKPKGITSCRSGAMIRYIVIVSMKVLDPSTCKRSIAHFYRDCEIWPLLDLATTLSPAPQYIQARASKKLFMGGDGSLSLTASIHRSCWVAGQLAHVQTRIVNETRKTVRSLSLALLRTTTLFHPSSRLENAVGFENDPDACETETSEKKVEDSILISGQKGTKGHASAKGWWIGIGPGDAMNVCHCITIPPEALTIPRSRLIEVEYSLRVSLGVNTLTGNSEALSVTLPIRIVNFISLDPPPSVQFKVSPSIVIGLDTPKPTSYVNLDQIPANSRARPQQTNILTTSASESETPGLPMTRNAYHYVQSDHHIPSNPRQLHKQSASEGRIQTLPTFHALHDLGNIEDSIELEGALGGIPGSASILEESDISAEPGFGEGQFDGIDYGEDYMGISHNDEDREELVDSDDELEMMVGCASAAVPATEFYHTNFCDPLHSHLNEQHNHRDAVQEDFERDSEHRFINNIDSIRDLPNRDGFPAHAQDTTCRKRSATHISGQASRRTGFETRVQDKRYSGMSVGQNNLIQTQTSTGNNSTQIRDNHIRENLTGLSIDDSPGSIYSPNNQEAQTHQSSFASTTGQSRLNDSAVSHFRPRQKSNQEIKSMDSVPGRPTLRTRALTAPTNAPLPIQSSNGSSGGSSSHVVNLNEGLSPVRARIAMLEKKAADQAEAEADALVELSNVTRSVTTSAVPVATPRRQIKR